MIKNLDKKIKNARNVLNKLVVRSPVRKLGWLEDIIGVPVWVKLEHYQHTGSFKYRGASYVLSNHPKNIPIIAASAGNHGLAVANVGKRLKINVNICLPTNASRLKRQRIINTGVGLIEYGSSLDESIEYSQYIAIKNGWRFISPYNDESVILANSTLTEEFLEDVPDLKNFIIPIGGGGLISGMALSAHNYNKEIKIFGCEPENYPSMSTAILTGKISKVANLPTLADGLAVNLEKNSITLNIVNSHVREIVKISEEDLALGTYLLINKESILVEPSGCAGIAALLALSKKYKFSGPIGIPLCGGNIQKNTLNRILEYPFSKTEFFDLLDLKGQRLTSTPIIISYNEPSSDKKETSNIISDFESQFSLIKTEISKLLNDIDSYNTYCKSKDLIIDQSILLHLKEYLTTVFCHLNQNEMDDSPNSILNNVQLAEIKVRWALQAISHVKAAVEWRSASYDQAIAAQFFDLSSQDNPAMNYDRYQSPEVKRIEEQLNNVFSIPTDKFTVSVVSSGMAAYSLIESFLLRYILSPESSILIAPYIYFEAKEQLEALKNIKLIQSKSFCANDIFSYIENDPSIEVVFVDPLANIVEQPMTDIDCLIKKILLLERDKPIKIIIDGTMVSGGLLPNVLHTSEKIDVIYYESCSKYLQLGLELCLAGVVILPSKYQAYFERLRRNSGSILYRQQASSYPVFSRNIFLNRMARISETALHIATLISSDSLIAKNLEIFYPQLNSHPDYNLARKLPYVGGCITLRFRQVGKNNNNFLDAVINIALHNAKKSLVPLTKGVSFGFNMPRISAASSIAESEYPFLRLYTGDIDVSTAQKLAGVMLLTIKAVLLNDKNIADAAIMQNCDQEKPVEEIHAISSS